MGEDVLVVVEVVLMLLVLLQSPNMLSHFKHIKLEATLLAAIASAAAAATVYEIPALYCSLPFDFGC